MNRVLILTPDSQEYLRRIRQHHLPATELLAFDTAEEARDHVARCNIILGAPPLLPDVLANANRLQWVQSTFAGVERLCQPGLRRDYLLTGIKGVFGPLMSEYVFAHILFRERHLAEANLTQQHREWDSLPYRSLQGLTLGICGLGSIGRHVAGTAHHFGMRVLAYKRTPGSNPWVTKIYQGQHLETFLAELDYLVLAMPGTSDTRHLIDAAALRAMKRDAVLINVGRGDAVVEADLVRALRHGDIAAAVLDVFEQEPLPTSSRLWSLPNVTITPHNAARSFPGDVVRIFCDNYRRFLAGKTLENHVDFEVGY